tara:strand:- start:678 stop:1109 length:432 start_codon:yes stop_codon:yes gene_type:complete
MIYNLSHLTRRINKSSINIIGLKKVLSLYNGNDWMKYMDDKNKINVEEDYSKILLPYHLNNMKMYLLKWEQFGESSIHNHGVNGCIFKVLDGSLIEEVYKPYNLKHLKTYKHDKDHIKYIDNEMGLHKIINNNDNKSYSLHIY